MNKPVIFRNSLKYINTGRLNDLLLFKFRHRMGSSKSKQRKKENRPYRYNNSGTYRSPTGGFLAPVRSFWHGTSSHSDYNESWHHDHHDHGCGDSGGNSGNSGDGGGGGGCDGGGGGDGGGCDGGGGGCDGGGGGGE